MGAITIQQMADRVAALMEERLGIKGTGLAAKLRRGGRRLPRKVRTAAEDLAEAAHMSQNPKLLLQVDETRVAEAYDLCLRHLVTQRRTGVWAAAGRSLAASLVVLMVLVAGVAVWIGGV